MRKFAIPTAVAIITAVCLPAHAAKYTCVLTKGTTQVKSCSVDPTTTSTSCSFSYSAALTGVCALGKNDNDSLEAILCGFAAPSAALTAFTVGADPAVSGRTLTESPGFATAAYTFFATATRGNLAIAYRENSSAEVLSASCQ